jgi:hypothetical protein
MSQAPAQRGNRRSDTIIRNPIIALLAVDGAPSEERRARPATKEQQ